MNIRIVVTCILVCIISLGFFYLQLNQPLTYAVGDQWVYEHKGPRPFKDPSVSLNGDRTREIVRCETSDDKKVWVFRDEWGDPSQLTICYVDEKNECCRFEEENNVIIENDTPFPFEYRDLAVNETSEIISHATMRGMQKLKLQISATRLSDEAVATPAGNFQNCRHIKKESTITDSSQTPPVVCTYTEDYWYHPSVNGFVKYELDFHPIHVGDVVVEGYKASSELKQFIRGKGAEVKTIAREESA